MDYDQEKVDEMLLALLYLTSFREENVTRAWKSMDWDALDRLFQKGYIQNPKSKAKSVLLTETGEKLSREYFLKHFAAQE